MTHELKEQIAAYQAAKKNGLSCVMATLVALEGSSYRPPGVTMLLMENGDMVGAVSGGCVEKEILKQAGSVFVDKIPKMMTYDGRYRLGCDGVLHILIEPFDPQEEFIPKFEEHLKRREPIVLDSTYSRTVGSSVFLGTTIELGGDAMSYFDRSKSMRNEQVAIEQFRRILKPSFRLVIIGAEHDAAVLTKTGASLGWEVLVVTSASSPLNLNDFPGATDVVHQEPETLNLSWANRETAVVLMTHSYARDLNYLLAIHDANPLYIGMLGPARRRDKLLNEFTEHCPEIHDDFLDGIYGPAGLNLGAETPQEIALSICAEILSVQRNRTPMLLRDRTSTIHS
jgi:xanthine dehydrogenase accessory factor